MKHSFPPPAQVRDLCPLLLLPSGSEFHPGLVGYGDMVPPVTGDRNKPALRDECFETGYSSVGVK